MNEAAGVFALLENARRHHSAAELLVTAGFRGFAITHHILGAEESVKAWATLAQVAGYDVSSSDVGKVFHSHTIRHEMAAIEGLMTNAAQIAALGLTAPTKTPTTLEESSELIADLVMRVVGAVRDDVSAVLDDETTRPDDMKWWDSANGLKNAGLYVDASDTTQTTPDDLDEDTYSSAARITKEFSSRTAAALTPFAEMANRDFDYFRKVVRGVIVPVIRAALPTL